MKLNLFSKSCSRQHSATRSVCRLLGIGGIGLILCGDVGFAQPPTDAGTLFLQAPTTDPPEAVDDKQPAEAADPVPKAADTPVEPAPPPVRALPSRAKAYSEQIGKLRDLKEDLINTPLTEKRIDAQIDALTKLIQAEAEERLTIALEESDTKERDKQLKDLIENRLYAGTPAAEQAGDLLQERMVDGKLYPDVAAAKDAQDKLDAKAAEDREKAEQKANAELEKLANKDIDAELRRSLELVASEEFESIRRLVPAQQVCRLQKFIDVYPGTRAAEVAQQLITLRREQTERFGQARLQKALAAPLFYDQRWRRLKELVRDYPQTSAAIEAESLLNQHRTTLTATTLQNHWSDTVGLSIETLYDGETIHRIAPGESLDVTLMFPALLRVSINDDVEPMRIVPGSTIGLHPSPKVTGFGPRSHPW